MAPVAGRAGASISIAAYPVSQPERIDEAAIAYVAKLKQLVDACRNLRGEMQVSPATKLPLYALVSGAEGQADAAFLQAQGAVLKALAKLNEVTVFSDEAQWKAAAGAAPVCVFGNMRFALFMQVDKAQETARLGKEAARLEGEIAKAQGKLNNDGFVAKAPAAVLELERKRVADFGASLEKIKLQLAALK